MDSRKFIKEAAELIKEIEDHQTSLVPANVRDEHRASIQKEVTFLFAGLTNPTLPSAYRLRDVAVRAGYSVNLAVLQRLRDHEFLSAY